MQEHNSRPHASMQKGMVLLEALIAILIFSIGVLAIVGLQATMITNTSDTKARVDAANIAEQRLGQMWSDPDNILTYLEQNTDISGLLPNGKRTTTQPVTGQFTVTVTWQQPGDKGPHNFTTTTRILGY